VIDAQYFYPDGVAAVLLGRWLDRPVTITARGSDLNVIARYALPRRMIVGAARGAAELITVCAALRDVLAGLGVPASTVTVLRNGVDLAQFRPPGDRAALRVQLGLAGPVVLSVGNLVPLKGHDLVIRALAALPGVALVIAGAGPEEAALRRLASEEGVADRVRFLGRVDQATLTGWYGAADAFVLASESEGLANVLLESMACGTPVAATAVGGTPEVVSTPAAGELIRERTPAGIAAALGRLLARDAAREATRRHAEGFSWDETARGLRELLARAAGRGAAA